MKTIDYYNKNAKNFADRTLNTDMSSITERFLKYIPRNGKILDFGCGSGRDLRYFKSFGYFIEGVDGSVELAKIAREISGVDVTVSDFKDFECKENFDGIWACAVLVHFPLDEMKSLLNKLVSMLNDNGILYFSVRKGNFEGVKKGRYFKYLPDSELQELINSQKTLKVLEYWVSEDQRKTETYLWHNVILRKQTKYE